MMTNVLLEPYKAIMINSTLLLHVLDIIFSLQYKICFRSSGVAKCYPKLIFPTSRTQDDEQCVKMV